MSRNTLRSSGFTIPEVLMAVAISAFLTATVIGMWYFAYKNWSVENVRTRMRANLEVAMERIKSDARLSSATYTSGYPDDAVTYEGLSLPLAQADENGFFALDGENIYWDTSVLYHLYENDETGNKELRRTVFTNNHDIIMDSARREAQLASVVENGDGSAAENAANSVTDDKFLPRSETERSRQTIDFSVSPKALGFNGYSPDIKRTNVSFGCINLAPGYHDLTFEVIGKDEDSSGFAMGIDSLSITPSGSAREMEVCVNHNDLLDTVAGSDGGVSSKVGPDETWSGKNYFEFSSGAVSDFVTFRMYYDLWRESNWRGVSQRENTILTGDDLYVKLPNFLQDEGIETTWQADDQTGVAQTDYNDAGGNPYPLNNITVRNVVSYGALTLEGDLVRVNFACHSPLPSPPLDPTINYLKITSAYIDERDGTSGNEHNPVYNPAVPATNNTRVQLFFNVDANGVILETGNGNIEPGGIIPLGESRYSNWAIYPITIDPDNQKDYLVTFHIESSAAQAYVCYWPVATGTGSYLHFDDYASDDNWAVPVDRTGALFNPPDELPDPPDEGDDCTSSRYTYVTASLDVWSGEGSITSESYDTELISPAYDGTIRRTEFEPAGSSVVVQARSSDTDDMQDASEWGTIGNGRYAQFRANLSSTPYWTCINHPLFTRTDADYKSGNMTCATCGEWLSPAANCPWIDNVTISWPGTEKVCEISGYFVQKPNYGIISLSIDGQLLQKSLEFKINVSEDLADTTNEVSLTAEVQPRNTGK